MDAGDIWNLIDSGGAIAAMAVFAGYVALQNRNLTKRNDVLVDRYTDHVSETNKSFGEVSRAIERLTDKLNV